MLGSPLFQILFFTYLGRLRAAGESDAFFIVGNAIQVCAMSAVYGMTMAVANERQFGTLGPLLASPANRLAVFLGRGVPVLANGLVVSAFGFLVGVVFLDFRPAARRWPGARADRARDDRSRARRSGCCSARSGCYGKDFFFVANLAYFLLLLFCGVNVPLAGAARLDAGDRPLPAAHARDRGGARRSRPARASRASPGSSGRSSGSARPTRSRASCSSGCSSRPRAGAPCSTRSETRVSSRGNGARRTSRDVHLTGASARC